MVRRPVCWGEAAAAYALPLHPNNKKERAMKSKTAYCLTATLLLFAGCDNMGTRPAIEEPEGAFQIVCFELGITNTGLFETTGAIVDEGTVEGDPLPEDVAAGTRVVRYRTFNSEKGYIAVRVEARFVTDDTRTVEGSYTCPAGGAAPGATGGNGLGDRLSCRLQQPGALLAALSAGFRRCAFAIPGGAALG
jgi:hypothetical protein